MNLCGGIDDVYKTEIAKFLDNLKPVNEINNFLILLSDSDYESVSCFPFSLKQNIEFHSFPGILRVEKLSNIHNLDCIIEDIAEPKTLYMMLPKENIYISKNYESRYLQSKINEFTEILRILGPSEITIETKYKTSNNLNLSFGGGVKIHHLDVNSETGYSNEKSNANIRKEKYKFPNNENLKVEVFRLYNCHYLSKMYEWHEMIKTRVENQVTSYGYNYINTENKKIRGKLIDKLKLLSINVSYDKQECLDVEISFDVTFNPLKAENVIYTDKNIENNN